MKASGGKFVGSNKALTTFGKRWIANRAEEFILLIDKSEKVYPAV